MRQENACFFFYRVNKRRLMTFDEVEWSNPICGSSTTSIIGKYISLSLVLFIIIIKFIDFISLSLSAIHYGV